MNDKHSILESSRLPSVHVYFVQLCVSRLARFFFRVHAYPDRVALLQLISNVTLLSHSRLHSVGRCVPSMTPWPWLDPAFWNFLCDSEKWWWVDSDTESLRQIGIAFPVCLCERKSHGYWVHSISKLHVPKQQATPQANRQGISEHSWPSMIRARLSQTDFQLFYRVTWLQLGYFETPLLEVFFHWFSRGTFCRIGWSYRARCKQKWKYMPPGTSSLATGQSCQ